MQSKMFRRTNFRLICVVASLFFLFSAQNSLAYEKEINSLSSAMAEKIANASKSRVAVVDFTDLQGNVTEFGRFLAEEFSVALASAGKGFKVVDRTHLQSILKEHKLSQTGLIDPETARELGKITGVEALITGAITPFGESVRLAIKILDTTTAEIIDAQRGNIPQTQAIEELLGRGIESGALTTPATTTPPITTTQLATTPQSFEMRGFTFTMQSCKRSDKNITCSALMVSNEKDEGLYLDYKSTISDDLGNTYYAEYVQLGGLRARSPNSVYDKFFVGVPKVVVSFFKDVSPEAKMITTFGINFSGFGVQFLNVPILASN